VRESPLESSIAQALDNARGDHSVVAADVIELTGRIPLVALDLGASEE
jgi:hypothetical protein